MDNLVSTFNNPTFLSLFKLFHFSSRNSWNMETLIFTQKMNRIPYVGSKDDRFQSKRKGS